MSKRMALSRSGYSVFANFELYVKVIRGVVIKLACA